MRGLYVGTVSRVSPFRVGEAPLRYFARAVRAARSFASASCVVISAFVMRIVSPHGGFTMHDAEHYRCHYRATPSETKRACASVMGPPIRKAIAPDSPPITKHVATALPPWRSGNGTYF